MERLWCILLTFLDEQSTEAYFHDQIIYCDDTPSWQKELPASGDATCRGVDIPYEEGFTYRVAVDGFIVSDNVTATAENINAGFAYSDNNPVKLTFTLAAQ
jgi:hypothetical protein